MKVNRRMQPKASKLMRYCFEVKKEIPTQSQSKELQMRHVSVVTLVFTALLGLAFAALPSPVLPQKEDRGGFELLNQLAISVTACSPSPCTPDQPVEFGETIRNQTPTITITVTSNFDCAGQATLTALGAPGFAPVVGIATSPEVFFLGGPDLPPPYNNGNSVTTLPVTLGVLPNGTNSFKISASCNGAEPRQFAFAAFEFSTD